MSARKDYTDEKFGKYTIVKFDKYLHGEARYIVQCLCGTKKSMTIGKIKKSVYKACSSCRTGPNSLLWKGYGQIHSEVFRKYKRAQIGVIYHLSSQYNIYGVYLNNKTENVP